jgi:hypothetical protein
MKKTEDLEVKKFDVNPLSYIPGGSFITIEFSDGSSSKGVNIKHPRKYVETVIVESLLKGLEVTRAYLTGKSSELVYEDGMFFSLNKG